MTSTTSPNSCLLGPTLNPCPLLVLCSSSPRNVLDLTVGNLTQEHVPGLCRNQQTSTEGWFFPCFCALPLKLLHGLGLPHVSHDSSCGPACWRWTLMAQDCRGMTGGGDHAGSQCCRVMSCSPAGRGTELALWMLHLEIHVLHDCINLNPALWLGQALGELWLITA